MKQLNFVKGRTGYRSNEIRHPHSWNIMMKLNLYSGKRNIGEMKQTRKLVLPSSRLTT
jgi:hypothetical protein